MHSHLPLDRKGAKTDLNDKSRQIAIRSSRLYLDSSHMKWEVLNGLLASSEGRKKALIVSHRFVQYETHSELPSHPFSVCTHSVTPRLTLQFFWHCHSTQWLCFCWQWIWTKKLRQQCSCIIFNYSDQTETDMNVTLFHTLGWRKINK